MFTCVHSRNIRNILVPLAEAILGGTLEETKIIWNFEIRFLVVHLNLIITFGAKSLFTLSVQTRIFPPKLPIKFKCTTRKIYNLQEEKENLNSGLGDLS